MQVEEALEYLRAAGLSGAAKYAAGSVFRRVDEAHKIPPALEREAEMVLARVGEAWSKLVSLPPGARGKPYNLQTMDVTPLSGLPMPGPSCSCCRQVRAGDPRNHNIYTPVDTLVQAVLAAAKCARIHLLLCGRARTLQSDGISSVSAYAPHPGIA